jgi:cytochrome c551/c552
MGVLHNAASWSRPGDATLTAAILDCLAMHAIRTDIDGPSYRQHIAGRRAADRAAALCAALSPLVSVGTSAPRTPDASDLPGDARTALA